MHDDLLTALAPRDLETGPHDAITDVPGVLVGQRTLGYGEGPGAVRTGVTVVRTHGGNAFRDPVTAAVHVINGFGKATGLAQVAELGVLETPIALTNTLSVGAAFDGLVDDALAQCPEIGTTAGTVNPVVLECNDSPLNDIRARAVSREHVAQALAEARSGPVACGGVGAGTGMTCFGWKGGIGTASRRLARGADAYGLDEGAGTLGVLVLTNYGTPRDLVIGTHRVGQMLQPPAYERPEAPAPADGSCVIILATDLPLDARQLGRVARRAQNGIARTGGDAAHGSGEFVMAFSTTHGRDGTAATMRDEPRVLNEIFHAVGDAVAHAVWRSLLDAEDCTGRDGHRVRSLPAARLAAMLAG